MFRISRDVRFAVDLVTDASRPVEGRNGYAGKPPMTGVGQCFYRLVVSVAGEPDAATGYLVNIKTIDEAVRDRAVPLIKQAVKAGCRGDHRGGGGLLLECFGELRNAFSPHRLDAIELHLSPFTSLATSDQPAGKGSKPMILLHHTFEFAASHRLHNAALSEDENRRIFGKCNNPHGHGHNYVLRITLRGEPDANGVLIDIDEVERVVDETILAPFDHRHLNLEVPEFAVLNPSVENIAKVIFGRLRDAWDRPNAVLDAVTVWETPKTWCEYREGNSNLSA